MLFMSGSLAASAFRSPFEASPTLPAKFSSSLLAILFCPALIGKAYTGATNSTLVMAMSHTDRQYFFAELFTIFCRIRIGVVVVFYCVNTKPDKLYFALNQRIHSIFANGAQ